MVPSYHLLEEWRLEDDGDIRDRADSIEHRQDTLADDPLSHTAHEQLRPSRHVPGL